MTKGRALIQAYESVRPLAPAEREALPMLARGAALRFLLTRLYDWLTVPDGALVTPRTRSNICENSDSTGWKASPITG